MWRYLVGILLGVSMASWPVWALRIERPPEFTTLTPESISQLNTTLWQLWNLSNGRYELEETTSNPNGTRQGNRNELIAYNNGGSYKLCVNVSTAPGGTSWRCSANTLTVP